MKFQEYVYEKEKREMLNFFEKEKIEYENFDLDYLIESGLFKKALKAGAVAALLASPFLMKKQAEKKPENIPTPQVKQKSEEKPKVADEKKDDWLKQKPAILWTKKEKEQDPDWRFKIPRINAAK